MPESRSYEDRVCLLSALPEKFHTGSSAPSAFSGVPHRQYEQAQRLLWGLHILRCSYTASDPPLIVDEISKAPSNQIEGRSTSGEIVSILLAERD